jgi:hypothetical protein
MRLTKRLKVMGVFTILDPALYQVVLVCMASCQRTKD